MKNKTPVLIAFIAIVMVLGAFIFTRSSHAPEKSATNSLSQQPTQQPAKMSPITSVKDLLSQSISVQCTFTDDEGRQTETYIKNGAVRSNFKGETPEKSGSMIMKNKKLYMWTNNQNGFVMEVPDTTTESNAQKSAWGDTLAALEKYKKSCKPMVVSDSFFTPPSTIKFTDYSQMMKAVMQQNQQAPAGAR